MERIAVVMPVEEMEKENHEPPTGRSGGGVKPKSLEDTTTHAVRETRLGCEGGTATIGSWLHQAQELDEGRRPNQSSANVREVRRFVGA